MATRLTLKTVNDELMRLGHRARLEKASGYFYFFGGEATDWLDRTVQVAKISDLTREEWVEQFRRLKKVNAEIMRTSASNREHQREC
jgi:hypothetical protein